MPDCTYFGRVLRIVERRCRGRGLTFYLTWDVTRLPSYGASVVAIVLGDEWCRRPAYAARVRAVFHCYGDDLMLGPLRRLDLLALLVAVQWLRTSVARMPFRVRGLVDRAFGKNARVYDIPLGYLHDGDAPIVPLAARSRDVWFAGSVAQTATARGLKGWLGTPKSRVRRLMIDALDALRAQRPAANVDVRLTADFTSSVAATPAAYGEALAQTKICVAPRGTSFETFRWFEGLRSGCVVVGEALPRRRYYDGAPYVRIEDWRDAVPTLSALLDDPARMDRLHAEALDWWRRHCSEDAVGTWIAQRI